VEAVLSNSTRKPLWFEITKMLIAVKKYFVTYYNFRHIPFPISDVLLLLLLLVSLSVLYFR